MATSSSSSSKPSLSPHRLSQFTPIEEGNEDEEWSQGRSSFRGTTPNESYSEKKEDKYRHQPTPLHQIGSSSSERKWKSSTRKRSGSEEEEDIHKGGVSCNNCRPSNREKLSIVPLDNNNNNNNNTRLSITSTPNGIFKNVFSSLVKKSPRSSISNDETSTTTTVSREDQWKSAIAELSYKLMQATRKRDEAVVEVSRLKYSMSELEKKLNKLESYCQDLKSNIDVCSNSSVQQQKGSDKKQSVVDFAYYSKSIRVGDEEKVIEHFLVAISEARSSIRVLSRSLTLQLKQQVGGKVVCDRIALHLEPYDVKMSSLSRNARAFLYYLEALLNKSFFEDFELIGFQKNAHNPILNPIDRCESNFASFGRLQGLTWEEVLNKGTKHFSEEFSKFCDRKMSEIVAMLGWNRAWPEPLLQAFFSASKAVWLVHLLANSVHPNLPIFRVDKDVRFDTVYMEDIGGDKARKMVPTMVRIMVTPGFYVYDNVVKCKVICRYYNNNGSYKNNGLTSNPT